MVLFRLAADCARRMLLLAARTCFVVAMASPPRVVVLPTPEAFPLRGSLSRSGTGVDGANRVDRVGVVWPLVVPVSLDAGEPQGDATGVSRARLDAVERHLHHELRSDEDRVLVAPDLKLLQAIRLPGEHGVGHALE